MTLSEELETEEQIEQVVFPHEGGLTTVYDSDKDGNIIGIRTVRNNSISEAQVFDENHRQRVPAGSSKGGEWVKGSAAGDSSAKQSGEEMLSQTKEWRRKQEYYGQKRREYAAYEETGNETPHVTPAPNEYHMATAYKVLELFPDMDEETMIKNSWLIDIERDKHIKSMAELKPKLIQAISEIEGAELFSRVKTRFKTLEKMGRKRKYDDPSKMGDISGYMVIAPSLKDIKATQDKSHIQMDIDPERTEDFNEAPKDGYRAVHEEIILPDGTRAEIQYKTPNQKKWAEFAHDNTYKPDKNTETGRIILDNMTLFQEYNQAQSEYFHQIDLGNTAAIAPPCPDLVRSTIGCL